MRNSNQKYMTPFTDYTVTPVYALHILCKSTFIKIQIRLLLEDYHFPNFNVTEKSVLSRFSAFDKLWNGNVRISHSQQAHDVRSTSMRQAMELSRHMTSK